MLGAKTWTSTTSEPRTMRICESAAHAGGEPATKHTMIAGNAAFHAFARRDFVTLAGAISPRDTWRRGRGAETSPFHEHSYILLTAIYAMEAR